MFRETTSNELFTLLLVVCLLIVTLAKLINPVRFDSFISVITTSKYLKIYSREQKLFNKFDVPLLLNLAISGCIFILILYKAFFPENSITLQFSIKVLIGIIVFIALKIVVEYIIGNIVDIEKNFHLYLFQRISYANYIGILLIPLNALLIYSFNYAIPLIHISLALIVIVSIIGLVSSMKSHESLIKGNFFYFILYLCALEIAPYIILYKVFFV
ncbi:MAG: DUF4271 domain-containing protein [Aestuariibaculum sp.]